MIRATIIAPALAVRAGLRALLGGETDIQVIAEGTSLSELEVSRSEVDVVIWSPAPSADTDGERSELAELNLGEMAAVLVIDSDPQLIEALSRLPVRAWGLIDAESTQAELIASIHALNEGLVVADPLLLNHWMVSRAAGKDEKHDLIEPLTEREVEILQLLAYGLTNKQIAARLKISAHTVKFHVSSIFNKMGATNRVETVNLGLKNGLIVL